MFKKAQSYKPKREFEKSNLEINRVVIESYYGSNRRPESKIIKINNNVYNIKNIDNNMSRGNLNISDDNENKNKNNISTPKPPQKPNYSISNQTNIYLVSHIKKFDSPLLINNNSFNFIIKKNEQMNDNKVNQQNEIENKKMYLIKSFDIFICGNQNLKSKNIHITKSTKKDNVGYREIIDIKNIKNELEEKKIELNDKEIEKNNLLNSLDFITKRWKQAQIEFKTRISYINKNEVLMINLEKYKQELMSKINFEKNTNNDNCFIMINKDMKSKENNCNYEIINYDSTKDFDKLFNNLIQNNNKENNSHLFNDLNNKSEKKKSKFSNQNSISNNHIKNINSYFPLLILKYTELKNIIDDVEKNLQIPKKDKENKYIFEKNISFNFKGIKNKINQIKPTKKEKEKINKKQILIPTKVNELKFTHNYENLKKKKIIELKIDKSRTYEKEKEKLKNIKNKKTTKDFSQSTPISLLKEKYFIYAVSKWSKYSTINSEINIYLKYNYKAGHPKFDSNALTINNFYLGIEKIILDGYSKKSRNTDNFTSFKKTISTSKVTTKTNNEINSFQKDKHNTSFNVTNNKETSIYKKKSKSKQKIDKKKNK